MALCASVMTGIYAAPVMADNTAGIVRSGETTTIENTVSVDKWGLKVLDKNGKTVAYVNSTNGGINAAKGKFHVYSDGGIAGTSLSLWDNNAQNVLIDNTGMARFGAKAGNNVRIENGVLYVNRNNEQLVALGENGLTLTSGDSISGNYIRATLDAEQIANLNSTIKEGGVVDAKELNVTGATGGLYVKDVTNNDGVTGTMIYTKAADGKTNTMWIDPNTGNLNTVGSIGVGSNLAQPVTQINGIADANGDGIGDINVGISYNKDGSVAGKKINLDASTGNINLVDGAKVDGVDVSKLSTAAADISELQDKTQNINSYTEPGTTAFDGSVIADSFGTTKVNGNRAFWVNKDGMMEAAYGKFAVDADGNVTATEFTAGGYNLTDIGEKTAGITQYKNDTTYFKGAVNVEGSIYSKYGKFVIGEDSATYLAKGELNLGAEDGQTLTADKLSTINSVITDNGEVVSQGDVQSTYTKEDGSKGHYYLNKVGADLYKLEGNVGNIGDNVKHIEHYDDFTINGHEYDATVIEESVAITKDRGIDVIGANGASVATITRQGVARFGAESDANVRIENGGVYVNGSYNHHVASLSEDGLTLGAANLNEAQLSNINTVIGEGGVVTAADGSVIGGVGFTSGAMTDVVSINGASVEAVGNGGLKISGVELENGLINGVNINDLDKAVAGTSANVGGITREAEDGAAPGEGTTTIENNLKVNGEKINMFGDTGLTFDEGTMNGVNVISVSGNIGFNGSNVHFSYGSDGKTTTLGGLALTVDQIATDVSAIKEKTDHITVDDKGNVTISADDGSSLTVGKDGTSTGQGGQVTTDGNHTVNGNLDVDGSGQIDKDLTVGGDLEVGGKIDASEVNVGNTHITKDNGIETDKITVSGQGGSAIINGGYVGGSNDVFIDANGNNIFDEGETSLSGVNGKVDKVASDLGDVSILDSEIAGDSNNDGQNDVVGAVNNEAEIRRSEIERVDGRINNLENRVGELEDRIDKVGAMAAAIANLRTMGYDPAAPTEVAVGIGQYRDETGAALGLFHYPNRDFMLSLSVSTAGDEVMGGIGATWKFGRKSPEKVAEIKKAQAEADARRAEEAKLAKAEEMKQAAKEAKIKAQQERHAKLAAERAAQAEAAK